MRNAYYIDDEKEGKTLTLLGRIHDARIHADHIRSVIEEELQNNRDILYTIHTKKENTYV